MKLTMSLLLLIPALGQADPAPTRYVPKEGDFRSSLDLRDGEYRYTYWREAPGEKPKMRHAVGRDLVRWFEAKGPVGRASPRKSGSQFELPVDGDPAKMRLLCFCMGAYWIEDEKDDSRPVEFFGPTAEGIAPLKVGSRYIQIINRGLAVPPHEIRLVSTPKGPRLIRAPVRELDVLHGKAILGKTSLAPDAANPLADLRAAHFDVQTKIRPGMAKVSFQIRGMDIVYDGAAESLTVAGEVTKLPLTDKEIELRMLTSDNILEIFADGGSKYIDESVHWDKSDTISVRVTGDPVLFRWLDVFELRSPDILGKGPAPDATKESFGVTPVAEAKEKSGFVVAGKNPTELLGTLTEIHGVPLAKLERDMQPGALARAGFLGPKEKLLDILVMDNKLVVDKLGMTHQEIARPLRILGELATQKAAKEPIEFVYRGRRFQARAEIAKAHIESPFQDELSTNVTVTLWNLDNGKSLTYSTMVPHLMERYGFYEGRGTSYRVEPSDVLEVFDFLRP